MQLLFESFQFPARFIFLRLGVGELGASHASFSPRGDRQAFGATGREIAARSRGIETFNALVVK